MIFILVLQILLSPQMYKLETNHIQQYVQITVFRDNIKSRLHFVLNCTWNIFSKDKKINFFPISKTDNGCGI